MIPIRASLSITSWARKKTGLVGDQLKVLLLGMILGGALLLFTQELGNYEYQLNIKSKESSVKTKDYNIQRKDDVFGMNVLVNDNHIRKLKRNVMDEQTREGVKVNGPKIGSLKSRGINEMMKLKQRYSDKKSRVEKNGFEGVVDTILFASIIQSGTNKCYIRHFWKFDNSNRLNKQTN